jgi:glutamine amidotransferase
MRKEKVVVVDYGVGNLFSVQRALEHCGASNVYVSSATDDVISADRLIIPGVGAFGDGLRGLTHLCLVESINAHAAQNKPLLGICLGMQLLATVSEEFGSHPGLNLIPGRVIPMPECSSASMRRKVPFVGWATLSVSEQSKESGMKNVIKEGKSVYFAHSFHYSPDLNSNVLATYDFYGIKITAAVQLNNIFGFQFHPEKSGQFGLELLRAFLKL